MTVVHDDYADAVDETYNPELDGYDGDSPYDRVTTLSRLTGLSVVHAPRALAARAPPPTIVVPFIPVGEGDHDRDAVYAVKRAWARYQGGIWRLRKLQSKPLEQRRRWGAPFSQEFGARTYTKARHQALAPFFDAYALKLLHSDSALTARDKQIAMQLSWHNALYNRRMQVAYSQVRPSQLGWAGLITRADCSGSVAGGCDWAKVLPAVDWRYTNTWVQNALGKPVPGLADAVPGDVFLYGSPSHEALYLGNGLVWSFGSFPIKILRHDYRHDRSAIRRFVPL